MYASIAPGEPYVSSSDPAAAVLPSAPAVSGSPSVSAPGSVYLASASESAPSTRGSIVATPIERPSVPAPHRHPTQAGANVGTYFPLSEVGGSEGAVSDVHPPPSDSSAPARPPGDPGAIYDSGQSLDVNSEGNHLKAIPAPAHEHTAPSRAVVGSGGASGLLPLHSASSSAAVAPAASMAPVGIPEVVHPQILRPQLTNPQLQHLSPEQQQQYFAQQQQIAQSSLRAVYQPHPYPAPAPVSTPAQNLSDFQPANQQPLPGLPDRDNYSGHNPSVYQQSYVAPAYQSLGTYNGTGSGFGPEVSAHEPRGTVPDPTYQPQEKQYHPGTFQHSPSYWHAVQGVASADEAKSTESHEAPTLAGRPAAVIKAGGNFLGRVNKLFRADPRDTAESNRPREEVRASSPSKQSDDSSDWEDQGEPTPNEASAGGGSGGGWHTRTDSNLRSTKGDSSGQSFLARASQIVGMGRPSSVSDEEGVPALQHTNGQNASETASTRTGKRSLLSRMSGIGSNNAPPASSPTDKRSSTSASLGPQENDAEMQRLAHESVVGAGIGRQPKPVQPAKPTTRTITAKGKGPKKVVKRTPHPAHRTDSEAGHATASKSTSAGEGAVRRSSSISTKGPRTVTVTGDASTGVRRSRISSAGHGSAAGKQSSVMPLPVGKHAISNWVANSKDVPPAAKPVPHNPKTRISSAHVTSLSGKQVDGFPKALPEEVVDRDKTPRPRASSNNISAPGSRPTSRTARGSSATPTASTPVPPPPEAPLVVSAPPRARDVLSAPSYSGPRATTYTTPTAVGVAAQKTGADVNSGGQPNYLTHYDPPMEDARSRTVTPNASRARVGAGSGTDKKIIKRSSTAIGTVGSSSKGASTTGRSTPITRTGSATPSGAVVKRHVSLKSEHKPTIVGKHVPAAHDARPLSPALKSSAGLGADEGRASPALVARRKSVRMAPDTKFTENPRPVSRTAKASSVAKKKQSAAREPPAHIPPPLVTVPFQATAPGSSIVKADEPGPLPLAPSIHSPPSGSKRRTQAPATRPASAPAPAPPPETRPDPGFVARAPGSSLANEVGYIPSAPGSSVGPSISNSAASAKGKVEGKGPAPAHNLPKRRASNPAAAPRSASAAGWSSRIGRTLDDSSDDELPTPRDTVNAPENEYARARRAFSSASHRLGMATGDDVRLKRSSTTGARMKRVASDS